MSKRVPRHDPRRLGIGLLGLALVLLATAGYCLSVHLRNNQYLIAATNPIFLAPGSEEEHAKALAHFVAVNGSQPVDPDSASLGARIEHLLPFELSPVTVLKEGFAFPDAQRFGACGQLSRTVRAVAWLRHMPSHKVLMGRGPTEHAMVELYADGAWRLFDPTIDFYWTNCAGHVASLAEVRRDTAILAEVFRRWPRYPYRLSDAAYFRWSRLGAAGRVLRRALVRVMGRAWVEAIDTPKLYDRPWWGYAWTSFAGAAAAAAAALVLLARSARERH